MLNESRLIESAKPDVAIPSAENEQLIASLRDQVASLELQIATLASAEQSTAESSAHELTAIQTALQSAQAQLASSLNEIESIKQALGQRDTEIAKLQSELKSLSDERDLNQVEQTAKTESLESQLNASMQMTSQLSDKLVVLTDSNNRLEQERNRVVQQYEAEHRAHSEVFPIPTN